MGKRIMLIVSVLFICLLGPFNFVMAAPKHVSDCYEPGADCSDTEQNEQDESDEDKLLNNDGEKKKSLLSTAIQTIFALLLVLALIYILLKFMKNRNKSFQQVNLMENHGGISVGSNKSIQIIQIGSSFYLVGVGNNVELLSKIEDEALVNELLTKEKATTPAESVFKYLVKRTQKKNENPQPTASAETDFTKLLNEELDIIKQGREEILNKQTDKGDQHE